jgi:hypothetical protein
VSTEKVQIVERAMNKLTRPSLDSQAVQTAEQLLTEHAVILAPAELKRFAQAWRMLSTRTDRNPSMTSCNKTAATSN